MSISWLIILSIIGYIAFHYITARYLVQVKDPPKPVGAAGMAEGIFGILLGSLLYFTDNKYLAMFFIFLVLFWIGVAVSLFRGSRAGRAICLILSILRIPTIIGAFFSLFTLHKLYFTQEAKDFFDKTRPPS